MIGCVTALTKTTKENGATIAIPGSHLWGIERQPLDEDAIPAELEPGDAFIFLGNLYHAGGGNTTQYALASYPHNSSIVPNSANSIVAPLVEMSIAKQSESFFASRRCARPRTNF